MFAALVIGGIFLALTGENPFSVYQHMVETAFGSSRGISETLISASPLILTGLAAAVAFKMLVWNIGAEGQFLLGAIFSVRYRHRHGRRRSGCRGDPGGRRWPAASAERCGRASPPSRVSISGVNEIITTLMLNFIALNLLNYLIFGSSSPWRDPEVSAFPTGRPIPDSGRFPEFFNRLDIGFIIAIASGAPRVVSGEQDPVGVRGADRR